MPAHDSTKETPDDLVFRRLNEAASRIQKGESKIRTYTERVGDGHYVVRQVDEGSAYPKVNRRP